MVPGSSIILRFRDLSTPAGTTTVSAHREKISQRNYVWWGWWRKQGETVPEDFFREVLTAINKDGHFDVYLFDSGTDELRRARMVGIEWDRELKPIATPERDVTPDYYGDSHYLAWFKFSDISNEVLPKEELQKWSYFRNDEFFEAKKSIFDAFYDKHVSSFKELRSQDRTIWFIRPAVNGDGVHEVHVYDRSKTAPSNFPDTVIQAHTNNFLWISDPHFSDDHHSFPRENQLGTFNLSESIRRDLARSNITSIGGLLISGDLTWRAAPAEFDWAFKFINDVMSWSKLTPSHVLLCPGNHDLAFSNEPAVKGSPAVKVAEEATVAYKAFYEKLYETLPNTYFSCGRRFWMPDGFMVDVASLNSSLLQQVEGALQGQGFLSDDQLTDAAGQLKWSSDQNRRRAFRICMLHHHVVPIVHRELPNVGSATSVVHDAGAFMRWLVEQRANLVLHGHMHLSQLLKQSRMIDAVSSNWHEIAIAALGSSGVSANHRGNEHNSYGLITFRDTGVHISMRKISADDAIPPEQRQILSVTVPIG